MNKKSQAIVDELSKLYEKHGGLKPEVVVDWAESHPDSALHSRFEWDDTVAGREYRLWQAREIITEVRVTYPDGREEQTYVSPIVSRGKEGYVTLVSVLSNAQKRAAFLAQALEEYERAGEKYKTLKELAAIRQEVAKARKSLQSRKSQK